jgi:RNA polymerase sigma-70 factor (ECF subfamily)
MTVEDSRLESFVLELTRHQMRLRGLVRCLLFDPKSTEDVLQDTNVVLLRKAAEFSPGTDFWAWASVVAKYQVLTHAKRVGRDRLVFDDGLLAAIANDVDKIADTVDARREALSQCLRALPEPQRQLLEMRYSIDYSVPKMAAALGRPEGSIRQTLYRIRQSLMACVESRLSIEGAS